MTQHIRFAANKLVRDKTKTRVVPKGINLHQRIMEQEEYLQRLQEKLIEEAHEVAELNLRDTATKQDLLEELADVLEVMHSIAKASNVTMAEVEQARAKKNESHGGFEQRIFGIHMDVLPDSEAAQYYRAKAHKYPEINLE
jgi:predicted house-cleaning noncanonical NTP pyrophosphatase (MazG superfamily)